MTEELKLYSKDQLAVWYYNETLKNKSSNALTVLESFNKIVLEAKEEKEFKKELEVLLRKYGLSPMFMYDEKMLVLNGDLDFLETVRKKCGLDEDGNTPAIY
jgi:hypothetical protein